MNIADNIRKMRTQKNISIKEMAGKLNISRQAYEAYEKADSMPRIDTLQKIAFALSCEINDLTSNKQVNYTEKIDSENSTLSGDIQNRNENKIIELQDKMIKKLENEIDLLNKKIDGNN